MVVVYCVSLSTNYCTTATINPTYRPFQSGIKIWVAKLATKVLSRLELSGTLLHIRFGKFPVRLYNSFHATSIQIRELNKLRVWLVLTLSAISQQTFIIADIFGVWVEFDKLKLILQTPLHRCITWHFCYHIDIANHAHTSVLNTTYLLSSGIAG